MFSNVRLFIVLTFVLPAVACNKPASPAGDAHGAAPVFMGQPIYPHSQDFKTKLHGQAFLTDRTTCAKCHGDDFTGGSAHVSCKTCHDQFPHATDWGIPRNHGAAYLRLADDKKQTCAQCHAPDNPTSGISCQNCHAVFPHNDTFIAGGHADAYRSSEGKCLTCHERVKKEVPEMAQQVSCQNCHVSYFPHPSQWALPLNHGHQYTQLNADGRKECLACHTGATPSAGINCNQCHSAFPHTDDFINGGHGTVAKTFDGQCLACHTDFKRNMPDYPDNGCMTCHDGKIDVGWKPDAPSPSPSPSPAAH